MHTLTAIHGSLVATILGIAIAVPHTLSAAEPAVPAKRSGPNFTISKATTYYVEPLAADGYVDYLAAINRAASEGVTRKTNAAVLFWQAVGPNTIDESLRDKYFKALEMAPLPLKGDYYVDLEDYLEDHASEKKAPSEDELKKLMNELRAHPWTAIGHPQVAAWLEFNRQPLALIVEASKRPRRFDPICVEDGVFLNYAHLPALNDYEDLPKVFCIRAMKSVAEGKLDAAWDDILVCHRLARLAAQGQGVVDALVGYGRSPAIRDAMENVFGHPALTKSQVARYEREYLALGAFPSFTPAFENFERAAVLDAVCKFEREGVESIETFMANIIEMTRDDDDADKRPRKWSPELKQFYRQFQGRVNWDLILKRVNHTFDLYADIDREEDDDARVVLLEHLDELLDKAKDQSSNPQLLYNAFLLNSKDGVARWLGAMIVRATEFRPYLFVASKANRVESQLDALCFRLAAFHADNGRYPAELRDLVPAYLPAIPLDPYADGEFRYKRGDDGYLLYSLGQNAKDDGGFEYDGETSDWDLVVRVSHPKSAK